LIMRKTLLAFALSATALVASPAMADNNVVVTSLVTPPVPTTNQWGVVPGENSAGATAELSQTNVNDTDGSLHIAGDRVRVQTGIQYEGPVPGPSDGLPTNTGVMANDLVSFTGSFIVNALGTNDDASAAFRVLIQDPLANGGAGQRSELIWEAANQVGYTGSVATGVLLTAGPNDLFWQFVNGCGPTVTAGGCPGGGTYVLHTLQQWGDLYNSSSFVSALSVGVGSGAGSGFDANIDNLALTTNAFGVTNVSRYNFAAVPEPATWAMMLLGFGGIGASMRRQRRTNRLAQIA
jgi:hypothetical protein